MNSYKNIPLNSHEYVEDFDPRHPEADSDADEWLPEEDEDESEEDEQARKERIDLQNLYCREENL